MGQGVDQDLWRCRYFKLKGLLGLGGCTVHAFVSAVIPTESAKVMKRNGKVTGY